MIWIINTAEQRLADTAAKNCCFQHDLAFFETAFAAGNSKAFDLHRGTPDFLFRVFRFELQFAASIEWNFVESVGIEKLKGDVFGGLPQICRKTDCVINRKGFLAVKASDSATR